MRANRLIIHMLVTALALLVLAPFLWLLRMSFETNAQIFAFPPRLWFSPTLENYVALWQTEFRHSFLNSTIVSLASTAASMLVGVPAAYALSRMNSRSEALSLWIIASRLAPPTAFAIPYFLAYRELDLIDTRLGLVIIYLTFNISLVIWLMRSFFENGAGRGGQLHELRGLGMGPHRRRRHDGHAAGAGVLADRPPLPDQRADRRRGQGLKEEAHAHQKPRPTPAIRERICCVPGSCDIVIASARRRCLGKR